MNELFDKLNLRPGERRLVIGVLVVVFVVINSWVVWPHFGDLEKLKAEFAKTRVEKESYEAKISVRGEVEQRIVKLEEGGAYIPQFDRGISIQRIVDKLARESGITISQRRPGNYSEEGSAFMEQSYTISIRADDDELVDFLVKLASGGNERAMIRVRDMNFKPTSDQTQLDGSITVVASYEKTEQENEEADQK